MPETGQDIREADRDQEIKEWGAATETFYEPTEVLHKQ